MAKDMATTAKDGCDGDDGYDEHDVKEDWMQNILNFPAKLEDEGIMGIAQVTVAQTTSIAASIALAATTAALHVASEASVNAGRLLTGNVVSNHSDFERVVADYSYEDPDHAKCNDDGAPFVLKVAWNMLGVISPMWANDDNRKKCQIQNQCAVGKKKLMEDYSETRSLNEFYDADLCDESVYFDATSSTTTTLSTDGTSSSMAEEDFDELSDQTFPMSIVVVKESKTYYLDLSGMLSEFDVGMIPLLSLRDNCFAVKNDVGCMEPLHHILEVMVERSLSIAMMDSSSSSIGEGLCWTPDEQTRIILQRHLNDDIEVWKKILEGKVLKWTSSLRNHNSKSDIPMLKTQGVINMKPLDLKELLLDCDRVRLFNKNSMGKEDVCTFPHPPPGETKIVKNVLKIPIVGGTIQTLSLTHSRGIEDGGFAIVSQSVKEEQSSEIMSNQFYSISILRPVPNSDKTELTNIAQTSSLPIPKFLMRKVGFMGAVDFFKNLRELCSN